MNTAEEIRKIQNQLGSIERRLTNIRAGGGGGGPHNILSTTHSDALTQAVTKGDMIIGNATPKWSELPIGNEADILKVSAGLPIWEAVAGGGVSEEDIGFYDHFKDEDLFWAWNKRNQVAGVTCVEASDHMTIEVENTKDARWWNNVDKAPRIETGFPGMPCELTCLLDDTNDGGGMVDDTICGIFISRYNTYSSYSSIQFGRLRDDSYGGGRNGIGMRLAGLSGYPCYVAVTTIPVYLKIRLNMINTTPGGTVATSRLKFQFFYSLDGSAWTQVGSDWVNSGFNYYQGQSWGLFASNITSGRAIKAEFDWVRATRVWGPGEDV